jgi:hypothetical protein
MAGMRAPPPGSVLWRVARLRGEPVSHSPIVACSWFEARAIAMAALGVEAHELEIVTRYQPPPPAKGPKKR